MEGQKNWEVEGQEKWKKRKRKKMEGKKRRREKSWTASSSLNFKGNTKEFFSQLVGFPKYGHICLQCIQLVEQKFPQFWCFPLQVEKKQRYE